MRTGRVSVEGDSFENRQKPGLLTWKGTVDGLGMRGRQTERQESRLQGFSYHSHNRAARTTGVDGPGSSGSPQPHVCLAILSSTQLFLITLESFMLYFEFLVFCLLTSYCKFCFHMSRP
jgi:hypothetical protein